MNKSAILLVIAVIVIGGIYLFITQQSKITTNTTSSEFSDIKNTPSANPTSLEVDKSASFAIFTNGTFRIFTASMYHNLSKDVYIQADNPNIVYVKKRGITWDDFFKTLPFTLTRECLTTGTKQTFCTGASGMLTFYINGKNDINALDKQINAGDQLLVTYGNEKEVQIQKQLQQIPNIK